MMEAVNRRGKAIRPDAQEVSNIDLPEGKKLILFPLYLHKVFSFQTQKYIINGSCNLLSNTVSSS